MKKRIAIISILVLVTLYIVIRCLPNEKDRVRRDIVCLAHAVEQENKPLALEFIDPAYSDRYAMTFEELVTNLDDLFVQAESIRIQISGLKITIDSTNSMGMCFANCSLGLKIFAHYEGTQSLLFGGIIKPASVQAWFKKTRDHYRVYNAQY